MARPKTASGKVRTSSSAGNSYPGILGEPPPIYKTYYPAFLDPENPPVWYVVLFVDANNPESADVDFRAKWKQHVLSAREAFKVWRSECTELLLKHYSIDVRSPSAGWELAMALAEDHVPAFQVKREILSGGKQAKKPLKLDLVGTRFLFVYWYLKKMSERRALTQGEVVMLGESETYLKGKGLKPRTIRDLSQQMGEALTAFWTDNATDFQTQFVLEFLPSMGQVIRLLESHKPQDPDGI